METEFVTCACHQDEHVLHFHTFKDDKEIYISFYLEMQPWYKRVINAVKYVFGHRSRSGDFGEIMLDEQRIHQLVKICNDTLGEESEVNHGNDESKKEST